MSIITLDLVRRYMLATGWTDADEDYVFSDGIRVDKRDNIVMCVARVERCSTWELCARLGMLAAAESLLTKARQDPGGQGESLTALVAAKRTLDAEELVREAGLTHEAWEAAR